MGSENSLFLIGIGFVYMFGVGRKVYPPCVVINKRFIFMHVYRYMIIIVPGLLVFFCLSSVSVFVYIVSVQDQCHTGGGECTNVLFFCLFVEQIVDRLVFCHY